MDTWSSLVGAVALGINAHGMAALVMGMRARDAPSVARHARRCAWSAAGFALFSAVMLATPVVTNDAHGGDAPEDRAARMARLISESINSAAFTVLVALLPLIVAVVLHIRARRVSARA